MMKRILMVSALTAACCLAQEPAKKAPATTSTKKAAPAKTTAKAAPKAKTKPKQGPITIPPDAKETAPGTYRWVDPKGVAWTYTKTPFGIMRAEEKPDPIDYSDKTANWVVTDQGDEVAFERPYPFGGSIRWTRKKTELNEAETAAWSRSQAAAQNK
jgi:hypothetical protein